MWHGGCDQLIGVGALSVAIASREVLALRKGRALRSYSPFPSLRSPTQTAEAVRFMKSVSKMKTAMPHHHMTLRLQCPSSANSCPAPMQAVELLPAVYSSL